MTVTVGILLVNGDSVPWESGTASLVNQRTALLVPSELGLVSVTM